MHAGELVQKTSADYDQIARWINHGIKIGKGNGPGRRREYDEIDILVCDVLSALSPLIGSGRRVIPSAQILKKVATQLRKEPSIWSDRDYIFVSTNGVITETPKEGWVIST